MVVKFCCELQLHLKSKILISLSRKMSFVKKKTGDKVPWNATSAINQKDVVSQWIPSFKTADFT